MTTQTTITTKHIRKIERVGDEYCITRIDGTCGILDRVTAPTKKDAAIAWYEAQLILAGDHCAEIEADHTSRSALKIVGQAIRTSGAILIPWDWVQRMGTLRDAAQSIGMMGIGHTCSAGKYLMVAVDQAGIDRIKSSLDRGEIG